MSGLGKTQQIADHHFQSEGRSKKKIEDRIKEELDNSQRNKMWTKIKTKRNLKN